MHLGNFMLILYIFFKIIVFSCTFRKIFVPLQPNFNHNTYETFLLSHPIHPADSSM